MYRTEFWTLWEKTRVGCFKRIASKRILSIVKQITSPGWMHETSAWTWCSGKTQRDQVEREVGGGSGWGMHVNPQPIHVNVWQKPLQYCKVISLQLIKIKKKVNGRYLFPNFYWKEKQNPCVCFKFLCCASETIPIMLICYTPIQNKKLKNKWEVFMP